MQFGVRENPGRYDNFDYDNDNDNDNDAATTRPRRDKYSLMDLFNLSANRSQPLPEDLYAHQVAYSHRSPLSQAGRHVSRHHDLAQGPRRLSRHHQ
ncbi:hypothetical protein [uncultured Thiodictyon sp.]|uniref:hypothetical protein n=1 Tax=uncultured Thiodictyon sp. TaxID=1846217 RepID=UPI0026006DAC|nr:hypothetical protein [uncultured Thiodictyon sp.]